jgi:hypothetical protein
VLEHRIEMTARWPAMASWPLVFRPLHDALIEDALSMAQESLGQDPRSVPWSRRVRFLRWLLSLRSNRFGQRLPGRPHAG